MEFHPDLVNRLAIKFLDALSWIVLRFALEDSSLGYQIGINKTDIEESYNIFDLG